MGSPRLPYVANVGLFLFTTFFLTPAPSARAQNGDQPPPHIDFVEGAATLEREGQADSAAPGMPLVAGDRVRTDGGRVELIFPDGTALDVDEYTSIDLMSPTLLRATTGRVLLTVAGASNPSAAIRFQIDTPAASAMTDGPGQFRVAILSAPTGTETELAVIRGTGFLRNERGGVGVSAGQRSVARDNEAPLSAQSFNSARFDAFDQWTALRRDSRMGTAASAQYLPNDLRLYGSSFDSYGTWQVDADYGNVWYPAVDASWRPYYNGYWATVPSYGWTWIGYDSWAWPTHHYGRWGYRHSQWFWIPNRYYAPAWVSWGAAPGYVSWCPLGFNNQPVFAFSVNIGTPWVGWTVVPRGHFGWYSTPRWAVAPHNVTGTPFIVQNHAPVAPTRAIARPAGADGNVAGNFAVPRSRAVNAQAPVGQRTGGAPAFVDRSGAVRGSARNPAANASAATGSATPARDPRLLGSDQRPAGANRQPYSVDRRLRAADGSTVTIDRNVPAAERREQADTFLKQPLGAVDSARSRTYAAPAAPAQTQEAPRAYQRYPSGSTAYPSRAPQAAAPAAGTTPSGTPGWQTYSGANRAPVRRESTPVQVAPNGAAAPRSEPYSGARSRRAESPQPEATPPPSRSYSPPPAAPRSAPYRAPSATPRSAAPAQAPSSNSGNGESGSAGASRSSGSSRSSGQSSNSGSSGGARQRHP